MREEIILAGHGGQGILFTGQLIGQAGMLEGKNVCYIPSYEPEMRGGISSCSVIISDKPISCPLVTEPTSAVVLNQPSLNRLEPIMTPQGILIINQSLAKKNSQRNDLRRHMITANELALELGNNRIVNMIMLGALVKLTGILNPESLIHVLEQTLPKEKQNLLTLNKKALEAGAHAVYT